MRYMTISSKNGKTIGSAYSATLSEARNLGEQLVAWGAATSFRVWSRRERRWM
jgi:hypothetical protein